MSNYKNIIDQETENFIEYAKELATLEINFRTYINEKGLSEESYKLASAEYSEAIKPLKEKVNNVEKQLAEMTENTDYVSQDTLNELNTELGRIWRIIIANTTFCNEYGGVSFTDAPATNLYKEIYDKHLEELKDFMYYFIKVSNTLFSK